MPNRFDDRATDWPIGTPDDNDPDYSVGLANGVQAWVKDAPTNVAPPGDDNLWNRIDDNTVQIEPGNYTIDSLSASIIIPTSILQDRESVTIVDAAGNIGSAITVQIDFGGDIEYIDALGNSAIDTSGKLVLDVTGMSADIVRVGSTYRVHTNSGGSGLSSGSSTTTVDLAPLQAEVDAAEAAHAALVAINATDAELATAKQNIETAQAAVDAAQDASQLAQDARLDALEAVPVECKDFNGGHSGSVVIAGSPFAHGSYTPLKTQNYDIHFMGEITAGDAWLRIGTTPSGLDVHDGASVGRIDALKPTQIINIELQQGVEYFFTGGVGGGGNADNLHASILCEDHAIKTAIESFEGNHSSVTPLVYEIINGVPYALMQDTTTVFQAYRSTDTQVPLPNETQIVTFKYRKDPTNTDAGMLRLAGTSGNSGDFYFSYISKDNVSSDINGTGVLPELISSKEDAEHIQHTVKFTSDVQSVNWLFYPGAAVTTGASAHSSRTGVLKVASIDFNASLPFDAQDPIVVTGATGMHRIAKHEQAIDIGTAATTVNTGFDLNTYVNDATIKFFFRDGPTAGGGDKRPWQAGEVSVKSLVDKYNGAADTIDTYITVFDNDLVRVDLIDPATGELELSEAGRDLEYLSSELWLAGPTLSSRIGEYTFAATSARRTPATGWLPVTPGPVPNGAIDYPEWALDNPWFITGDDIVFPADVEDIVLRNLGGNALAEGQIQDQATAVNGLLGTAVGYAEIPTNTPTGGGTGRWRGTQNRPIALSSTDTETRMHNMALQLYTIVDTYKG